MADPFLGEIKMFAGDFSPVNWAYCDGQLLSISQNEALFSLLGTIYGGDGRTIFGLPDMRGRVPTHFGQGPGLTGIPLGDRLGTETDKLTLNEIPSHSHTMQGSTKTTNSDIPTGKVVGKETDDTAYITYASQTIKSFDESAVSTVGGNQPHYNMMPYLTIHFIISLQGAYPSRN